MSAVPGAPGGPPAGAFANSDPGAPPELSGSAADDQPAVEPGTPLPAQVYPGAAPRQAVTTTQPDREAPGEAGAALGQRSPFARDGSQGPHAQWDPWDGPDNGSHLGHDLVRSPYTALEGLGSGAAKGEGVLAGLLATDAAPDLDAFQSEGLPKSTPEEQAQIQAQVQADASDRVAALTPDSRTNGAATNVIHGLFEGGELAITGGLLRGPIGAATALSSAEGLARFKELKAQGVDDDTALQAAGLTGVTAGAGAFLPGGVGSNLLQRVASGVVGNVGLGGLSRYLDSTILEHGGYTEMAEQQRVWDSTQIMADAVLGSLFGGLAHLHAPGAEDAARTVNTTLNARGSAPGVPVDPAAAAAHEANLNKAANDLMQGSRVDVSDGPRGNYLERPVLADPEIAAAVVDHFRESGVLDEDENLADLQAQLADRMSGRKTGSDAPATAPAVNESEHQAGAQDEEVPDRRQNAVERQRVADMSPDELRQTLLTHDLTGIPNRRAYNESDKLPVQASIDVDSLKWVNDNLGHGAGDQMLKAVATALQRSSPDTYHLSGDEFGLQAHTPEGAHAIMEEVSKHLEGHTLEFTMPDGTTKTLKGLGVSYGVGKDFHEAEAGLQAHKAQRESAGLRARRGEPPPGAVEGDRSPGGQAVEHPAAGRGERTEPAVIGFTTAKGSTYQVTDRGTTIRDKSVHPEHPGDVGLKPESHKTYYVTPADANKLGEIQTQGAGTRAIVDDGTGQLAMRYEDGKNKGMLERRTLSKDVGAPAKGLIPVETWDGGKQVHFGNEITEVRTAADDAQAKQAGTEATQQVEATLENRIARDPDLREGLAAMKNETGWHQEGGRVLMDENGSVTGRTSWIPHEQWWADRPKGLTEKQVHDAIDKALGGGKLGKRQTDIVKFMAEVHDERIQRAGLKQDMQEAIPDLAAQPPAAVDLTELSARAASFDRDATLATIDTWNDDHPTTLARIQDELERIIGRGHEAKQSAAVESASAGDEKPAAAKPVSARATDLFGEAPTAAQALADEQRRRDAARSPGRDVSPETGDPSDLFSQARNQVDIADQALAEKPDLQISNTDGAAESARAALSAADAAAAEVQHDMPTAVTTAVDCFLRKGS